MIGRVRGAWRARWNVLRLGAALAVLWVLAADTPARLARIQLASLPDADFAAEVRDLRSQGRYAEALVVADAGLASAGAAAQGAILAEKQATEAERQSLLRRLKDLARGAVTGGGPAGPGAPDPSLELLIGAVVTDLFVVGDIRDLVIQGARAARGEHADPVIAALAGVGILTTLAPEIDWAPSLLKAARKAGAMTERFAQALGVMLRERRVEAVRSVMKDTASIGRAASPAGALRLMRSIDSAEDAARLARFLERTGPRGAHALAATGKDGVELVKTAEGLRAAGRLEDAVAAERVLLASAAKGRAGASWLARGAHRALLRPHPLVGLVKSVWKGNAQALIARGLGALDPFSIWTLPALAAWAFFEAALLLRRFVRPPPAPKPIPHRMAAA